MSRPLGRPKVPHPEAGENTQEWFARVDAYAAGSTLAVRKSVITLFGLMDPAVNEDMILPFRASLLGEVKFLDEDLVTFRRHAGSLTTRMERYDSIEKYRSVMQSGIAMARSSAKLRLADISTALEVMPARAQEFEGLQKIVLATCSHAELTGELVSSSFQSRLQGLLTVLRAGAYRDARGEHACLALWPALYLRWKRRRLARRIS